MAALTPICVAQFQMGTNVQAKLAALKEVKSWEQGDYVQSRRRRRDLFGTDLFHLARDAAGIGLGRQGIAPDPFF